MFIKQIKKLYSQREHRNGNLVNIAKSITHAMMPTMDKDKEPLIVPPGVKK